MNILVLLPDGAGKYISKIFNDDWMRENGFLEDTPGLGTVSDLLKRKDAHVVTARSSDSVSQIITALKAQGYSQLPVVDEADRLLGIVHEVDLLRFLAEGKGTIETTLKAGGLIQSDYATVTPQTKVELLQGVLADARIALVLRDNDLCGVVTKIDLIDYLASAATGAII
jgi:cystathionine beta-synthase